MTESPQDGEEVDERAEDDPLAALYGADLDEARGFHDFIWGSTVNLSDASMVGMSAQVTAAHEEAHKNLNDTTEYGIMLKAAALLHSRNLADPTFEGIIRRLGRSSRDVHEGYATFVSVCDVALGDTTVLLGSPEYLTWFENFSALIPGPNHSRLKHICAIAVAEMCMRVPCLRQLVDGGIENEESWHIGLDNTPDRRFAKLNAIAVPSFWQEVLRDCRSRMSADQVRIFCPDEPERQSFDSTYLTDHDDLVSDLYSIISTSLQTLMERHGMPAQSIDQAAAVSVLEQLSPSSRDPAIFERGMGLESEIAILDSYFQHEIILRSTEVTAELLSLREHPDLVAPFVFDDRDEPGICHVLLCLGQHLGRRFSLPTGQGLWVFAHANETFAVILGSPAADGKLTLLLADNSNEILDIVSAFDDSIRLNVSVAASSLIPRLQDRWRLLLEECDNQSVLQDFSLGQLMASFKRDGERIRYSRHVMKVAPSRGVSVVVLTTDRMTNPNIIICTKTQSTVLENYLDFQYPNAVDITGDPAFSLDEDSIRLGFLISFETLHAVKYPWVSALPDEETV